MDIIFNNNESSVAGGPGGGRRVVCLFSMRPFLSLLAALLLLTSLWPARAQIYFNERYGLPGSNSQNGATNIVLTDSGFVTCGIAYGYPQAGGNALQLRFLDERGRERRSQYFWQMGIGYFAAFFNGLMRVRGGYAMPGAKTATGQFNTAMLWHFDGTGDTLWTSTYPSPNSRGLITGCQTPDGGYALVGFENMGNSNLDMLLIRTDSLGQFLWERHYDLGPDDEAFSVVSSPDGGLLLAGYSRGSLSGGLIATYVVKTDALGQMEWQRAFRATSGAGQGGLGIAALSGDGNYLVAATVIRQIINRFYQHRLILYKLSPQGQTLWQREIGPVRGGTDPYAIHELADGSIVVAGQIGDPTGATPAGNAFPEGFAFKMCANGDSVWYRTYQQLLGPNSHNYLRDFHPTPDGGFVGAGFLFSNPPDTGSSDSWVFRVDSAGYLQAGGAPPTVRCPRVPTGIQAPGTGSREPLRVWPNPSADGRFVVHIAPAASTTLTVTDALGRVVWRGASAGAAEAPIDLSRQPPGLYLLRAVGPDGRTQTRKLVRE